MIIKPSSLNYKTSLRQAVEDFIKKESKIDDFNIEVEEQQSSLLFSLQDDFDDILFDSSSYP